MHLIRRALSANCLKSVVLLSTLATAVAGRTGGPETLVLDLTKPAPAEKRTIGAPGYGVGGVVGQPPPRGYPLPLAVELHSISPQPVKAGEKFSVELRLWNTGHSAFYLPASRSRDTVLKQGNKGRRTFLFSLVFEDTATGQQVASGGYSTDGSETVSGSFLRLEPGQQARVLFRSDLYPAEDWRKAGHKRVRVRAEVSEWKYEERRYYIQTKAEPVRSSNVVMIELGGAN
jgi:hypothetical protein